jgi:ribosome maturation factor RimP
MIETGQILTLLEGPLAETEAFLVDLSVSGKNKILIRIDHDKGVDLHLCKKISRAVESGLNRDAEDFELEVSSPGLDEPFKVKRQYFKNIGKAVEVVLADGRKLEGVLIGADNEGVLISEPPRKKKELPKEHKIAFENIIKTQKKITFK